MIPYGKHHLDKDDIKAVSNLLKSKNLTQGPIVKLFENKIAKYVKSKYAVAVSSCTAGLHLSSIVVGLKKDKTLLTSPISFASTANASLFCGGKVKFSDVDINSINISPEEIKKTIKKNKIHCIAPVHFGGLPADMKTINKICKQKKLFIIEDSAHAFGAKYDNLNKVGSCKYSDLSVFSFHPVKSMTTGEGGCITTNNYKFYKRLINLRSHGIEKDKKELINRSYAVEKNIYNSWYYEMQELGYHYRITDIQCALGISQFKKINKFLNKRRFLAERYDKAFSDLKNCAPLHFKQRKLSSNHLYVLRINFKKIEKSRQEIINFLKEKGITTQVHYIPIPLHPFYKFLNVKKNDISNSLEYYHSALSIPIFYDLTIKQQDYIIKIIKRFIS
jgi:perosamine synthetase|tara:strand:+ start:17493 stop:18662 length:1170 start_codon:yes stop_codon:yes gene_type:complete